MSGAPPGPSRSGGGARPRAAARARSRRARFASARRRGTSPPSDPPTSSRCSPALVRASAGVEARVAIAAVGQALGEPGDALPYAWLADVYAEATERGRDGGGGAPRRAAAAAAPTQEPRDKADARLAHLTLGHKKAMARAQRDPDLLARLAAEGDPVVVRELLRNAAAHRAASWSGSRRAARAGRSTLRCIFESRRWRTRTAVALALVRNPYVETELALKLLHGIGTADLRRDRPRRRAPPARAGGGGADRGERSGVTVRSAAGRRRSAMSAPAPRRRRHRRSRARGARRARAADGVADRAGRRSRRRRAASRTRRRRGFVQRRHPRARIAGGGGDGEARGGGRPSRGRRRDGRHPGRPAGRGPAAGARSPRARAPRRRRTPSPPSGSRMAQGADGVELDVWRCATRRGGRRPRRGPRSGSAAARSGSPTRPSRRSAPSTSARGRGRRFRGERVPLLEEVLEALPDAIVNVELKCPRARPRARAGRPREVIARAGAGGRG